MTIGERIRDLRKQNGLTQEELADFVKTTKQTIFKYETGVITNIPSDKLELIAQILHCSPAYLMGWDNSLNSDNNKGTIIHGGNASTVNNTTIYNNELSEQEQDLLDIYRSINSEGQAQLISFAYKAKRKYSKKGG